MSINLDFISCNLFIATCLKTFKKIIILQHVQAILCT